MFDLGWQEFLMVAVVLMLVVGPKDLPRILRSFSQFMRKARSMANEFTSSLEDVARQDEIKDMKAMMQDVKTGNFDDIANMIGGDVKAVAEDMKSAAGIDAIEDDVKSIAASNASKPAAKAAKKATSKPKKKAAKKTANKATKLKAKRTE